MLDVSAYEKDLADLRTEDFWLHRSLQERRLDRNPGRWGSGGKDCEGHSLHDAVEILCRKKGPHRAG